MMITDVIWTMFFGEIVQQLCLKTTMHVAYHEASQLCMSYTTRPLNYACHIPWGLSAIHFIDQEASFHIPGGLAQLCIPYTMRPLSYAFKIQWGFSTMHFIHHEVSAMHFICHEASQSLFNTTNNNRGQGWWWWEEGVVLAQFWG